MLVFLWLPDTTCPTTTISKYIISCPRRIWNLEIGDITLQHSSVVLKGQQVSQITFPTPSDCWFLWKNAKRTNVSPWCILHRLLKMKVRWDVQKNPGVLDCILCSREEVYRLIIIYLRIFMISGGWVVNCIIYHLMERWYFSAMPGDLCEEYLTAVFLHRHCPAPFLPMNPLKFSKFTMVWPSSFMLWLF